MCVQDEEQVSEGMEKLGISSNNNNGNDDDDDDDENHKSWPLHSDFLNTQMENWGNTTPCDQTNLGNSFPVRICFLLCFICTG